MSKINCGEDAILRYLSDRAEGQRSQLTGEILTVIDGAITDERQNKAVKDMISSIIRENQFYRMFSDIIVSFIERYCPEERAKGPKNDVLQSTANWFPKE